MERQPFKTFLLIASLCLLFCVSIFGSKAHAQSYGGISADDYAELLLQNPLQGLAPSSSTPESTSIIMHVIPENPAPNQSVTVNVTSYAENLDTSRIEWYVDNKLVSSGIGKKEIMVQSPVQGGSMSVLARITTSVGTTTQTSATIRPNITSLLWEATNSYVPPFYKGKALPVSDTYIKVVAIPEIKVLNGIVKSDNLVYSWEKDFTNSQDGSGYGKSSFLYKNNYLDRSNNIAVSISTIDQKYSAQARIAIKPVRPELLFYREDPNLGVEWGRTLTSPHKINGEETLVAAPYFFAPADLTKPELSFNWSLNNVPITLFGNTKNRLPLKVEGGTSGSSDLRLHIENKYEFFLTLDSLMNVQF